MKMQQYQRDKGKVSSGFMFIFWLLLFLSAAVMGTQKFKDAFYNVFYFLYLYLFLQETKFS